MPFAKGKPYAKNKEGVRAQDFGGRWRGRGRCKVELTGGKEGEEAAGGHVAGTGVRVKAVGREVGGVNVRPSGYLVTPPRTLDSICFAPRDCLASGGSSLILPSPL